MSNNRPDAADPIEKIILRSMNEGVITIECNGAIFSMNPAAERILQLKEDEVKGKPFEGVFSMAPENREFAMLLHRLIRDETPTLHQELMYKRHDGQKVDLSIAGVFLEVDECFPDMQNAVVVFRDITAFKSLERVKRKAVDHLSHELKTPLAIIAASVRLLEKEHISREQFVRNMDRVKRNLGRLTAIQTAVEEILTPFRPQPAFIDSEPFFREVLDEIQQKMSHRAVSLTMCVQAIRTEALDPDLVRSVVETLVKNAVENTPDGGEVILSFRKTPAGLLLQVQDFGTGISMSGQEFVLEGFYHTQDTDEYSTKQPFDFNAGGKGLELLRLKALAESGLFDISFESSRCERISTDHGECPGSISSCPYVPGERQCRESGGTIFSVVFRTRSSQ
jgi:two-component system phosphate regulon sensor histidine kinase PhoR